MCPNIRLLNATPNGAIYWFKHSDMAQVIFKNLCFDFYRLEYNAFLKYICGLDALQIEKKNRMSLHHKKISIPTGNANLTLLLDREELMEFQNLFKKRPKDTVLENPLEEIDYPMILN
ncbi:MAG: DUF6686 family protein [Bacteroidota bacterium]